MKFRNDKILYKRNLKAGYILSLLLIIINFYFFPAIEKNPRNIQHNEFAITISDVPSTRQESSGGAPPPPATLNILLPDEEITVALEDIIIPEDYSEKGISPGQGLAESSSNNSSGKGDSQNSGGVFVPRQILEVFPEKAKSKHTGEIKLSLKIGSDGNVLSHKILQNTTGSKECLENSIKAAYKSKWSPIKSDMLAAEYWVEKKYEFK